MSRLNDIESIKHMDWACAAWDVNVGIRGGDEDVSWISSK
jgi:hypothetical protein